MKPYVALLRGINVGGNNIIKMADLRKSFERMGFADAQTYIQSGNIVFSSDAIATQITRKIEEGLARDFLYDGRIMLRSLPQMREIVNKAPAGFGQKPEKYRYDVLFLEDGLDGSRALKELSVREGVDEANAGKTVLFFCRLIARITQSHLTKLAGTPLYKQLTIRN